MVFGGKENRREKKREGEREKNKFDNPSKLFYVVENVLVLL